MTKEVVPVNSESIHGVSRGWHRESRLRFETIA